MEKTKHTAGPWHIGVRQPTSDKFIYGPNGEEIADCDMMTNFADNSLANALLIAAAPDLLEALKMAVEMEYDRDEESRNFDDERLKFWDSLIAKAEGR